jgi:hypothetical protein
MLTSAKRMSQSSSQNPALLVHRHQNLEPTHATAKTKGMVDEAYSEGWRVSERSIEVAMLVVEMVYLMIQKNSCRFTKLCI